jgi:flavin-binding protein dodecin
LALFELQPTALRKEDDMTVYRVVDIIGSSPNGWEEATKEALTTAKQSLRHLRVAEVAEFDVTLTEAGEIEQYRARLRVSFKYEGESP